MRPFSFVVALLATVSTLAPASAGAQQPPSATDSSWHFNLHPELTKDQFRDFTAELGSVLRSRQLGDPAIVEPGRIELSVQFANSSIDASAPAWRNTTSYPAGDAELGRFMSFPRFGARFGVSERVDLGVSGGIAPHANYGVVGVDTKIAIVKQSATRPVSVTVRPSLTALFAPSEVWAGTAGVDVSVSRAFGAVSPYAGVAATTSGAISRSADVDLRADAGRSVGYVGVAYRLRALVLSAEVAGGDRTRYAFAIATRF